MPLDIFSPLGLRLVHWGCLQPLLCRHAAGPVAVYKKCRVEH